MKNLVNKSIISALSFLFVMAFSPLTSAAENPFGMSDAVNTGTSLQVAGKCGSEHMKEKGGKCGATETKKKPEPKKTKCGAGKCGAGKCGANKKKAHDENKPHEDKKAHDDKKKTKCGTGKCGGKM